MDANSFDPAATLSPDDPLRAWLQDPAMAEFVKQQAVQHAKNVLGFQDPYGNEIDTNTGTLMDNPTSQPTAAPVAPKAAATPAVEGSPDPTADQGPFRLDPSPPLPPAVPVKDLPPVAAKPDGAALDPSDDSTPANAPTDTSAQKKDEKKGDGFASFGKTLAGLKPITAPALNPVGTPSVRSPGAISAPNVSQLIQVMGLQNRPDPVSTLGRLLVAGKA